MDTLWSKHILSPDAAGLYGMTAFVASILFLNSSGIARAAISFVRDKHKESMLRRSYAVVFMICILSVAVFYALGLPILSLVTDKAAKIDHAVLGTLFCAITAYSLLSFSFQCLSVLHRSIHVPLSIGLAATQAACLLLFGKTEGSIALSNAIVTIAFTGLFIQAVMRHKSKKRIFEHLSYHHGHHATI